GALPICRLAAARGADDRDDLARRDLEVDLAQHGARALRGVEGAPDGLEPDGLGGAQVLAHLGRGGHGSSFVVATRARTSRGPRRSGGGIVGCLTRRRSGRAGGGGVSARCDNTPGGGGARGTRTASAGPCGTRSVPWRCLLPVRGPRRGLRECPRS